VTDAAANADPTNDAQYNVFGGDSERHVTLHAYLHGLRLALGQGLRRQWPQNLIARGEALLEVGDKTVKVKPRLVTDPAEARATSRLYQRKYGPFVRASKPDQPLTPGEQATFELLPAD